jgi:hypothetical protein
MNKRGVTLVLSFMVVLVLTILGAALLSNSISESRMAQRYSESTKAFWLASAGIYQGMKSLRSSFTSNTTGGQLGQGGYNSTITVHDAENATVLAFGFIPYASPHRAERSIEANFRKYNTTPGNFFSNVLYGAANITFTGSSYDCNGNVTYGGNITNGDRITGNVTHDSGIYPLVHLNFDELRTIAIRQGNYYNLTNTSYNFPDTFLYNATEPNVVFMEGSLDLSGKKDNAAGFFVVGGELIYDATISGNCKFDGCIYTLGKFTVNGGGNVLNINGGVWAGGTATIHGNSKLSYNQTYMNAIQNLSISADVQMTAWRDRQNPYNVTP